MKLFQSACATIALLALAHPAWAAGCATPGEASALKTAVMHQAMMVAALQYKEVSAYNRFINTYRGELQSSDASLKGFFVRRGGEHGEAGYDSFKTKAANISGLEQARDTGTFCADARALFAASAQNRDTLAGFVEARSAGMDIGAICKDSRPVLAKAAIKPKPDVPVAIAAAPTKTVTVAAAPRAEAPVRMAEARPDVAIGGVPTYTFSASPYRRTAPPAPITTQPEPEDDDAFEAEDTAPAYAAADAEDLPPRPRAYQIRERPRGDDAYNGYREPAYSERGYGPPPSWQWRDYPPPRPRWYRRDYGY
ncbi:MAG: hypothetical protein RL274_349 [Pseudomonadota bacterium]|jgi:hypothetical protein